MSQKKEVTEYSAGSKLMHWIIALLLILMLLGGFFLDDVPDQYAPTVYMLHKSFGLSILALMLLRVIWIIRTGKPALPPSVPLWQKFLSRLVQYALYFFVLLMPLVGWMMSVAAGRIPRFFGLFNLPLPGIEPDEALAKLMAEAHETIAWIIIGLVVFHVAGALKHHFIDKDNVLRRMLPGGR